MIKDDRLKRKEEFLEYYKDVPMQRFAAMHIGVSEDTIMRWKKEDTDFADSMDNLKAAFVREKLGDVKNIEWKLERMFRQEFSQQTKIDITSGEEPITGFLVVKNKDDSPDRTDKETI